jgi:hypothetical protein
MEPLDEAHVSSISTDRPSRTRTARSFRSLSDLAPDWIGFDANVQLCDFGLCLEYRGYEDGALFELVALWVGLDPRYVHEIPQWMEEQRGVPPSEELVLIHLFLRNLGIAMKALSEGQLCSSDGARDDPLEATVLSVVEFASWALQVKLPRPAICIPETVHRPASYTTPNLEIVKRVIDRHFRYLKDGGSYDPDDPGTHPQGRPRLCLCHRSRDNMRSVVSSGN